MKKIAKEKFPEFYVKTFGNFEMTNQNGTLNAENIRSEMLTRLLTYMVCNRNRSMTVQELIENLWSEEESENPAGALKNLMYRLRNLLKQTWGVYDYIVTGKGIYQWNPEIVFHVDAEEFETGCKSVMQKGTSGEKITKGKETVKLYKGMFIPEMSGQYWVISRATYYHSMYLKTVKTLAALMENEKNHIELETICRQAILQEPMDEELHCFLLRALIADNRQTMAAEHYRETVKYLYDNLGVRPSEEMQKLYENMQKIQHEHESNIDIIQEELKENNLPTGAFWCEYGTFRKIYALESRSCGRMGISVHLSLVSLHLDFGINVDQEQNQDRVGKAMQILKEVLLTGLRSSDIVCRYSVNQFLIMLPACQYEDAKMVMNRLKNKFYMTGGMKHVMLQYSIDEVGVD